MLRPGPQYPCGESSLAFHFLSLLYFSSIEELWEPHFLRALHLSPPIHVKNNSEKHVWPFPSPLESMIAL